MEPKKTELQKLPIVTRGTGERFALTSERELLRANTQRGLVGMLRRLPCAFQEDKSTYIEGLAARLDAWNGTPGADAISRRDPARVEAAREILDACLEAGIITAYGAGDFEEAASC